MVIGRYFINHTRIYDLGLGGCLIHIPDFSRQA